MKNKLLVTTALEETWGDDKHIYFLGEWCKRYDRKTVWAKRKYSVMPFHWSDRDKQQRDYDYLKNYYEQLLSALVITLNDYHKIDRSKRYWRIILGPWLIEYLAIVWDRWESLRLAIEDPNICTTIALDCDYIDFIPCNYSAAAEYSESHIWNHFIFADILREVYPNNIQIELKHLAAVGGLSKEPIKTQFSSKRKIIQYFDKILGVIQKRQKIIIFASYFSRKSLIKLSLRLKQIPRLHNEFYEKINMPTPLRNRIDIEVRCQPENLFENYLVKRIFCHMPVSYLEGYRCIRNRVDAYIGNSEIIFTSNAHFENELFKTWCAESVAVGKKLITSSHGGAIPSVMSYFNHEENISDTKVVWHTPLLPNQVQLSPNILADIKKPVNEALYISIIGLEVPMYSRRCTTGPNSSLILQDYEQKISFSKLLKPKIRKLLQIRPAPDHGWNTRQRYLDNLGERSVSSCGTLDATFARSKLLVCTYPQTTFTQAMHSGVPTILLYPECLWKLEQEYSDLLMELKKVNIVFGNSGLAAEHVNKIWDDPLSWWHDIRTTRARNHFFEQCCNANKHWLREWSMFFTNELNNKNMRKKIKPTS